MTEQKLNRYVGKLYRHKKRINDGLYLIIDTNVNFFTIYSLQSERKFQEFASVVLSPEWTEIL